MIYRNKIISFKNSLKAKLIILDLYLFSDVVLRFAISLSPECGVYTAESTSAMMFHYVFQTSTNIASR